MSNSKRIVSVERYYSEILSKEIEYVVSKPQKSSKELGLIVNLHSCHREPVTFEKCIDVGKLEMERWSEVEGIEDYVIIHPTGFGNTLFSGTGELDVFNCIFDIINKCSIDNNKIFLVGFSMGGAGALNIASKNPSFFCGVCSISGYSDYRLWQGPSRKKLEQYEIPQIERMEASFNIGNLGYTNILIAHGEWDLGLGGGVDYVFHKELTKKLNNEDISHKNIVFEKISHAEFPKERREQVIKWMQEQTKKSLIDNFKFIISDMRHSLFFGIEIKSLIDYSKKGVISGNIRDNSIFIQTDNIGSLNVPEKAFKKSFIDGVDSFSLIDNSEKKNMSGPISDIIYTKVFFCYDDTTSDEFSRSFQKEIATAELKYYNKFNAGISCGAFRTGISFFENQLLPYSTDLNKIKKATLVCYGEPGKNDVVDQLLQKANLKITENAIILPFEKVIEGEVGIRFIYRGENDNYFVINSGTSSKVIAKSFGIWYGLLPDFIIYNKKEVIYYGYFDKDWKFTKKNFYEVSKCIY